MSMCRSLDFAPGEVDFAIPDTSSVLAYNPPMDNQEFIDGYFSERRHSCDEAHHEFEYGEKANARRKIGLLK